MRLVASIVMILVSVLMPLWALVPLAVWYAMSWFAVELIVLGAFIDAYFGVGHTIPYYTLGSFFIVVISECAKPYLSFYTD